MKVSPSRPAPDRRVHWAIAMVLWAVAASAAAEWHGRASRLAFHPPPQIRNLKAASVGNAADAFALWKGSGVNGRRIVVLTGQWPAPSGGANADGSSAPSQVLTANSALYWAALSGVARAFDVVMPPAAFERRLAADASHKVFQPEDGAYRHDLHGFWLRFSLPRAFIPPPEPALVLIEPTWFAEGAPADPLSWLVSVGVRADLAVVALDDPAADDRQRNLAAEYARAMKLRRLHVRTE